MDTTENLKFDSADFEFCKFYASAKMYLRGRPKVFALSVTVIGFVLDVQVTGMSEMFNSLGQKLSTVEYLTLKYKDSLEFNEIEIEGTDWRGFLGSFGNVKTLHVDEELVEAVSHCLQVDGGESSLELLPELRRLSYSAMGDTHGPFKSFIDTRKKAGRPVTLICLTPWIKTLLSRSSSESSQGSSDASSVITSRSSEAGSDESGSDEAGSDEDGSSEDGSSETGSDEAGSSEAGSDEAGSSEAGSDLDT